MAVTQAGKLMNITFKVMHGTQLVHLVQAIPARMPLRVKIFMLSIVPLMS